MKPKRGVAMRFELDRESAKVILELEHKHKDRRLKTYKILEQYKVVLEEDLKTG